MNSASFIASRSASAEELASITHASRLDHLASVRDFIQAGELGSIQRFRPHAYRKLRHGTSAVALKLDDISALAQKGGPKFNKELSPQAQR